MTYFKDDDVDFFNALQAAGYKSRDVAAFLDLASKTYDDLKDQNQKLSIEVSALRDNRDFLEKDRREILAENERIKAVKCPAFLPANLEHERIVDELVRAHTPAETTRRNVRPSVDEVRAPRVSRAASEALATADRIFLQQDNERLRQTNARLTERYNARPPADELAEREIERLQRHLKRVRKSASTMAQELAEIRKQPKPCKCSYPRSPGGVSLQVVCPEHAPSKDWEVTLRRDINPHELKPTPPKKVPAPAPERFRVIRGCVCSCTCRPGLEHGCGVVDPSLLCRTCQDFVSAKTIKPAPPASAPALKVGDCCNCLCCCYPDEPHRCGRPARDMCASCWDANDLEGRKPAPPASKGLRVGDRCSCPCACYPDPDEPHQCGVCAPDLCASCRHENDL